MKFNNILDFSLYAEETYLKLYFYDKLLIYSKNAIT